MGKAENTVGAGLEAMEAGAESHLIAGGVDRGLISQARAAGLSLSKIIAIMIKYGPQAAEIIKEILAALKSKA